MFSTLHSEFQFANGIKTKNRFALAPMTTSQSLINGRLSADEFLWLKQCVQGGFGIIITCASHISLEGQGWNNELGIFDDCLIPSLNVLANYIKFYDALAILQIYHGGTRSPHTVTGQAPLDPNEMSFEKIQCVIEEFGNAAQRAESAGFDGIEIHGANGYLITQFISTQTNQRQDEYGGVLENRGRFLRDVVKNCRKKVSPRFIVGVRLSPENFGIQTGLKLEENLIIAQELKEQGADYLHISTWDALRPNVLSSFRKALDKFPILIAGGMKSPQDCIQVLNAGADIVTLGKIAIGNPFFPIKSKNVFYTPNLPFYSSEYLTKCAVSPQFKKTLKNFPLYF